MEKKKKNVVEESSWKRSLARQTQQEIQNEFRVFVLLFFFFAALRSRELKLKADFKKKKKHFLCLSYHVRTTVFFFNG